MSNDANQAPEEQSQASAGTQRILAECTRAVDDYRNGSIGKTQALLTITTELVSAEAQQSGTAGNTSALQSYLAMLDEVDRRKGASASEGGDGREPEGADGLEREEPDAGTPKSAQPAYRGRERAQSEESDEPTPKRARPNPAEYAWAASEFILESQLHPSVLRTLELLKIYGEDLVQAKRDLNASASAPEFPDSEWTNVLAGRAVDLDHIFAGRYTPGSEEKITERIGDLEFSFRAPIPTKKIGCFGDWVTAWKRASLAIAFAFPHRRDELDAYTAKSYSAAILS